MSWAERAACRGSVDTSAFFSAEPTTEAQAACARCAVRMACLADELAVRPPLDEIQGYRGGLTADQRVTLHVEAKRRLDAADAADRRDRARRAVAAGVAVGEVAAAEGVSRRTVARWLQGDTAHTLAS